MTKKTERDFQTFGFFNIHSIGKYQKIEGELWRTFFRKNVSQSRKYSEGSTFWPR